MTFRITEHAADGLVRRQIPRELLDRVLAEPQQTVPAIGGRTAYQSQLTFPDGKIMLLRAIVDESCNPAVVVTVYRTSKIAKYWSSA